MENAYKAHNYEFRHLIFLLKRDSRTHFSHHASFSITYHLTLQVQLYKNFYV